MWFNASLTLQVDILIWSAKILDVITNFVSCEYQANFLVLLFVVFSSNTLDAVRIIKIFLNYGNDHHEKLVSCTIKHGTAINNQVNDRDSFLQYNI